MADETHETKIVVSGDASGASKALSLVGEKINGVLKAVGNVTKFLSRLNWAVMAVTTLVGVVQKLHDKLTETARAVAKFKWDVEMRNAANETARLVGWHEKLAKLMKDELDTLSKQQSVQSIQDQGRKDYEDGKREADRARQIYEAKTPEEEQRLRDKFAAEDERREREDRKEQRKRQIENLDREESVYSSKARSLRDNNADIEKQLEAERFNLVRANGNKELEEPILKRIGELEQRFKANAETASGYEKEAKFRRDKIAALENQRDYDGPTAGEWQRKTEAKKREEKAQAEREKQQKAEDERSRKSAEEFVNGYQRKLNQDRAKEANNLSGFADRISAADGVSSNRLTAMGLGSGVKGDANIASDVKKMVKLLEEQIAATKDIDLTSTFGE